MSAPGDAGMAPAAGQAPAQSSLQSTVQSTLLEVTHVTRYDYAGRVSQAHHVACLRPLELPWQSVLEHRLEIDPPESGRSIGIDSFGNVRVVFAHDAPHERLAVRAHSRVALHARKRACGAGGASGAGGVGAESTAQAPAPLAEPWEEVAVRLRYRKGAPYVAESEFAFASPYIPLHAALRDYALGSFTPGRDVHAASADLMRRIHADFRYATDATDVSTPLAEAFRLRAGVCQDFAHVMIGALRTLGLAARYVSGYLLTQPPPGQPRLVGADASHAWVSVWSPAAGWCDYDPTNAVLPDTSHVTVGYGRDYGDVAPLRGVIRGAGNPALAVAVTVAPVGDEAGGQAR